MEWYTKTCWKPLNKLNESVVLTDFFFLYQKCECRIGLFRRQLQTEQFCDVVALAVGQ